MNNYVTFKRTALLMLMFMVAWCVPMNGQNNQGLYELYGLVGEQFQNIGRGGSEGSLSITAHIDNPPETLHVKLEVDGTNPEGLIIKVDEQEVSSNCWITFTKMENENRYEGHNVKLDWGVNDVEIQSGWTYRWTFTIYESQDANTPLETFPCSMIFKNMVDVSPNPYTITGNLNEEINFSLNIKPNEFEGTENVTLKFFKPWNNGEQVEIELETNDLQLNTENPYSNTFEYLIDKLEETTYSFTLSAPDSINNLSFELLNAEGQNIVSRGWFDMKIPYSVSQKDIEGLRKLATDNENNQIILNYINNKEWLNKPVWDASFRVEWDESTPEQVRGIYINNMQSIHTVDVSAFEKLEAIQLDGCSGVTFLNVSQNVNLKNLYLYGTGITSYKAVQLPSNPVEGFQVRGYHDFVIGTPSNDSWYSELLEGEQVNLSDFIKSVENASIKWYKRNNSGGYSEVKLETIDNNNAIYIMPAKTQDGDEFYRCEITCSKYPEWKFQTKDIKLLRGAINYNETDIQLLKNLAAANPECEELQLFVADSIQGWTEDWEQNYWNDQNRKVAVDWNIENPARISKLRIRNMNTVTNLDLSGFTELIYLDVAELSEWSNEQQKHVGLEKLDISKNTKLEELDCGDNSLLTTLDLSNHANLRSLGIYNNYNMQTLTLSSTAKFETVTMYGCHNLANIDLVASANTLKFLDIDNCKNLKIDLNQFSVLEHLDIRNTEQFEAYAIAPAPTIRALYCNNTNYPLLDFSKYPNIQQYGVPRHVEKLNVTGININNIDLGGSNVRYSAIEGGTNVHYNGASRITIPELKVLPEYDWTTMYSISKGDTIDFASEAIIDGIQSKFVWVDNYDRTESTGVFIPIDGELGKFVYAGNGRIGSSYHCIISNTKYCERSDINGWSGWRLETYEIRIQEPKPEYARAEVEALKKIVEHINSPMLNEWWNNGDWKGGSTSDGRASAWWIYDYETYTYHLNHLTLTSFKDSLSTIDLSAFTESIGFNLYDNAIETLDLSNNTKLNSLSFSGNRTFKNIKLPVNADIRFINAATTSISELDLSNYPNLNRLLVDANPNLKSLILPQNNKLEMLYCNYTQIEPLDLSQFPLLKHYGVPAKTTSLDLSKSDSIQQVSVHGSQLLYSGVTLKKGADNLYFYGRTEMSIDDFRPTKDDEFTYLLPKNTPIDLSEQKKFNDNSTVVNAYKIDGNVWYNLALSGSNGIYQITDGSPLDSVNIILNNATFSDWSMVIKGKLYSRDGDANLDGKVNVRDVVVTANHILENEEALPADKFGFYEADVTHDYEVESTDITGIINLILGKPVTKSGLRAAYEPTVELSVENGILYMDAEVPVASLQLELTGMLQAEPLLGKAASLTQLSNAGDTTRILGYSMKLLTVPAGKSPLMRFPEGARLTKAVFSDADAQSLKVVTKGDIATTNESIRVVDVRQISNYPNPFNGMTTVVYQLDENVDQAYLQVFSYNGSLVETVDGLSTQVGENRFTYTTNLSAGMYMYRLVTQKQGVTTYSKSNTFIIK